MRKKPFVSSIILPVMGLLLLAFFAPGCAEKKRSAKPVDVTVTPQNAYIKLFLDSADVYQFIGNHPMSEEDSVNIISFYRNRNYQYAWWDSSGITEQVPNFVNLYRNYASTIGDSSVLFPEFDNMYDKWMNDSTGNIKMDSTNADLLLTRQFFRYVERAYAANPDLNQKDLDWFIPKKQVAAVEVLNNVLGTKNVDSMAQALPVNSLFRNLMKQLDFYKKLESDTNATKHLDFAVKKLSPGDSALVLPALKAKLHALGDLPSANLNATNLYDTVTAEAVKHFQSRMGLTADGIIGAGVQEALNTPVKDWQEKILLNLERSRWLPVERGRRFLLVNIPAYTLYVFDKNQVQFTMGVVVGTAVHNTTIFSGNLKYVVMAPYWNVPYSIVKNEMGRTAGYFSSRNMEIVGRYSDGLPMVRQKPGKSNALGKVKFLFPNSYNIYLHDTPSKSLFGQTNRAFSHGCIRLSDPPKLAYYFLDGYKGWTKERIDSAMNGSKETTVSIDDEVPVLIVYLTAWVDPTTGTMNFRNDIYGHDKKIASRMFGTASN